MNRTPRNCRSVYAKHKDGEQEDDNICHVETPTSVLSKHGSAKWQTSIVKSKTKSNKKTAAQQAQAKYREKNKTAIREQNKAYSRKYQANLSKERKEIAMELTRKRVQAYRERQREAGKEEVKKPKTRKNAKEQELQREKWRVTKREQRSKMAKQKIHRIRKKDRERYQKKGGKKANG